MPEAVTETNYPPGTLYAPESPEERFEPGSEAELEETETVAGEQSGTIEDAGSPTEIPSREQIRKVPRRKNATKGVVPDVSPDGKAEQGDKALRAKKADCFIYEEDSNQ